MAGEVLTGGLSTLSSSDGYTWGIGLNPELNYANVALLVGSFSVSLTLRFLIGKSNKMKIRIYRKKLGESSWSLMDTYTLDSTDGNDKSITLNYSVFAAWLIVIEPLKNVVRTVSCTITVTLTNVQLNQINTGALLRICNNTQVNAHAVAYPFDATDFSAQSLSVSTSVGTLLQNGQWIFGQN